MSLHLSIEGSRPPSARSHSRINPITGEEIIHTNRTPRNAVQNIAVLPRPASRPNSRPLEVPPLTLGGLAYDKDPDKMVQLDPYEYKLDTPNSANTSVSWGTPTSISSKLHQKELQLQLILDQQQKRANGDHGSARQSGRAAGGQIHRGSARGLRGEPARDTPKGKQPTAWDRDPVPENLPPPSEKYKQQYAQYQQEMQESYRQKNLHDLDYACVEEKIEQLKLDIPPCAMVDEVDEEGDQTQKTWTQQPYSKKAMMKRQDIEELEAENRKKKLIETVMIDQLSRFVVCDPEQDEIAAKKLPNYAPPMKKGSYRKLHDSKLKTTGSSTENLLSKKIHFGARILTRNGRDAVRDLMGFFFAMDNTITIYEFRQFGKSAKALPFIKRGQYRILYGRRKGEHFSVADIIQGGNLSFPTQGQPLPDHVLEDETISFRITEVDDQCKAVVLLSHIDHTDRDEVWKRVHLPLTQEEMNDKLLQQDIQKIVHHQIKKRGVKVYKNLAKLFTQLDENGDGKINKYELEKGLIDFRIDIPQEKFDDMWEIADKDGTSFVEYDEFIRFFLGEMSEKRHKLARKAFVKMDPNKQGVIGIDAIGKFYNAHKHPKVISRELREDQAREQFVQTFCDTKIPGQVTYLEFIYYYEGLSVGVDYDEDFENILRNAWGV